MIGDISAQEARTEWTATRYSARRDRCGRNRGTDRPSLWHVRTARRRMARRSSVLLMPLALQRLTPAPRFVPSRARVRKVHSGQPPSGSNWHLARAISSYTSPASSPPPAGTLPAPCSTSTSSRISSESRSRSTRSRRPCLRSLPWRARAPGRRLAHAGHRHFDRTTDGERYFAISPYHSVPEVLRHPPTSIGGPV